MQLKIYFAHSKDFDFINEFYSPIENSETLKNNTLLFPHKLSIDSRNGREFYRDLDLIIAEVTYPATGIGMELAWAFDDGIPIYCFHRMGIKPSSSLLSVTSDITEYISVEDLVAQVEKIASNININKRKM